MNIITTTGDRITYDIESDGDFMRGKKLLEMLKDSADASEPQSDEEAIESIVETIKMINLWEEEHIRMVAKHYFYQLKFKLDNGDIDDIQFLYLQGKLVIEDLEGKWN